VVLDIRHYIGLLTQVSEFMYAVIPAGSRDPVYREVFYHRRKPSMAPGSRLPAGM